MTTDNDSVRAEFEAWAFDKCELHRHSSTENYSSVTTQRMYQAWQASRERYVPRWIPVSERLPEIDELVLWITTYGYMMTAERDKDDPEGYWEERFTHWQQLPATPNGGNES